MSRIRTDPPATLYGVLGLIAVRPATSYELAKRFGRSLGRVLPRARSKLFEAPKRLVELGYARATPGRTGRRRHTIYSITPKGQRALAAWLAEPGAGPELEFEQLLKVFFAEHGTKSAVVANLEAARAWAQEQIDEHIAVGRGYVEGAGEFPERLAVLSLTGPFLADFALLVESWAVRALEIVETWPDDPRDAKPDLTLLRESNERLSRRKSDARGV